MAMEFDNTSRTVKTIRMGSDVPLDAENINDHLDRVFTQRYTCRHYDPMLPIADRDWQTIIHAGWRSPSSMGFEPWCFVRITDQEVRDELISSMIWGAQGRCEEAAELLLIATRRAQDMHPDSDYVTEVLINQGYDEQSMERRKARVEAFIGDDRGTDWDDGLVEGWIARQAYIALGNMMSVASMLGIDSTPIEGFNCDEVNEYLWDKEIIDPRHFQAGCFVAFGYSRQPGKTKIRRDISDVYREI